MRKHNCRVVFSFMCENNMLIISYKSFLVILIVKSKFIPGFEDEAFGAVFSVLAYLVVFQHTEGLVKAAFATDIFRVLDITEIFCFETIEMSKDGIKLGYSFHNLPLHGRWNLVGVRVGCPKSWSRLPLSVFSRSI